MTLNSEKLEALLGTMVNELGAAANAALVLLGDKLGLYRALEAHGPLTPTDLARHTQTRERYVREWLSAQAASGFVTYDPATATFALSPEQAAVLADEESPVNMTGGFYSLAAIFADEPRLNDAFKSGEGVGWGDHCSCLFCGTERFFRPGYKAHLVSEWLPALDGVVEKLERGGKVADVGCGHGASTMIMAEAFPQSTFTGFDFHAPSIDIARSKSMGISNVKFEVAKAQDFTGEGYELVTIFDALHDMGDPVGAARHIRSTLADDGTLMIVEPLAGDRLEDNLNPVGRVYYAFSTSVCVPSSLKQEVGMALGAQAGEKRLAEVLKQGGFSRVRRAVATPFNMVIAARP
ncbi:Methyltransferase domain-containing protein [Filomicrobium insigne]|uniref:Methyltransferase domain-containing protein n=1 Tax=Filomicrobium insigne TaxID=418854 RepID=A0A1H0L4G0_9HYPH|nr:methyltransferase domain-containing protein [Filomicrobium insigne]SDO63118.1 Methyltransferase domain-containing protein [Filomicrobium insigne]